jgi:hypothetical protein
MSTEGEFTGGIGEQAPRWMEERAMTASSEVNLRIQERSHRMKEQKGGYARIAVKEPFSNEV